MNWDSPGRKIRKKVVINGVTYDDSKIIEMQINESVIEGSTLVLGTVVATQVTLKMITTDKIPNNAKVVPYICLEDNGILGDWVKLATVYIDDRTDNNNVLYFNCYDKLYLAKKQYNVNSYIIKNDNKTFIDNTTLRDIAIDIARILGVALDITFDFDDSYNIESLPHYTAATRDILGSVAGVHGACVRMDRNEVLTFMDFADLSIKKHFNKGDYNTCLQTNDKRNVSYAEVYTNKEPNYTLGTVTVPENSIELVSDFMEWGLNYVARWKIPTNYSYTPMSLSGRGDPTLKIGDRISIEMRDGSIIESIVLSNIMDIGIGLKQTIESPSTVIVSEFGRFSVIEEVEKAMKLLNDEFNIDERDKLFSFTVTGNAQQGPDYDIRVYGNHPLSEIPWRGIVYIEAKDEIYVDGNYFLKGNIRSYTISRNTEVSITKRLPKIWMGSGDPSEDEGVDGDIWVKLGGE